MQPPAYNPSTNFQSEETNQVAGRSTVRTAMVDAEHNNIATSINAICANLALIQRDDGELADGVVELHSLSADVMTLVGSGGFDIRGAWVTATAYAVGDFVTQGGASYVCTIAHTSGTFATDLAANKWSILGPGIDPAANVTLQQNLTVNGNTTLGDAAGDTVTVNAGTLTFVNPVAVAGTVSLTGSFSASDNSAIGQATATNTHLSIGGTISAGAIQVGVAAQPTIGSDGITRAIGVYSRPDTAVAAFTCADVRNFDADNPTLGAGSAITTLTGVHVRDLTRGTTNNFGVRSVLSSGAGKFNFYADGSAPSYFAGQVLLNQSSAVTGVLGAHTPALQMNSSGTAASSIWQGVWQNSNSAGPVLYLAKSRGASFPTHGALLALDVLGELKFLGSDGTDFSSDSAGISVVAAENFTNTAQGAYLNFRSAAIGQVTPVVKMALSPISGDTSITGLGVGEVMATLLSPPARFFVGNETGATANRRTTRFQNGASDANSFVLDFYKNRGNSIASPSAITSGDDLGQINAYGYVGATGTFVQASGIVFDSTGTITDSATGLTGIIKINTRLAGLAISETVRIQPFQMLVDGNFGAPVSTSIAAGSTVTPALQVQGLNASGAGIAAMCFSNNTQPPQISGVKSRGTAPNSNTIVQNGDPVMSLVGYAADGTNYPACAEMRYVVDGTPGAGDMPGRIEFHTTLDGASAVTERWRIENGGNLRMMGAHSVTRDTGDLTVSTTTSGDIRLNPAGEIRWDKANTALGGGAAPTLGTIGGGGPAAAAQRNWLRFKESDGTVSFIPVWR